MHKLVTRVLIPYEEHERLKALDKEVEAYKERIRELEKHEKNSPLYEQQIKELREELASSKRQIVELKSDKQAKDLSGGGSQSGADWTFNVRQKFERKAKAIVDTIKICSAVEKNGDVIAYKGYRFTAKLNDLISVTFYELKSLRLDTEDQQQWVNLLVDCNLVNMITNEKLCDYFAWYNIA